jgi:hypothetical protein
MSILKWMFRIVSIVYVFAKNNVNRHCTTHLNLGVNFLACLKASCCDSSVLNLFIKNTKM